MTPTFDSAAVDQAFQQLGSEFVNSDKSDGLSIAVVKDSQPRFYNFGSVSRTKPQTPTERSVYEIGSITKLFTSLLLAHAVTEGRVGLRDDIRQYLPSHYSNLTFKGTPVHLVDLADTTSALPENLPDLSTAIGQTGPDEVPFVIIKASRKYTKAQLFEDLKSVKLVDRPGAVPRHSNLATALLATILEKAYSDNYENLIARYVEKPFHMRNGTGRIRSPLLVAGYNERHVTMPFIDAQSILAAGGLRYSSLDMARFLSAELTASDIALRLSQTPAWGDPNSTAVGFNWILSRTIDNKLRLQTSGGTFGHSSYIEMYPDLGYGIVLLANRSGQTQDELQHLADQAVEALYGKPPVQIALHDALEAGGYLDIGGIVAKVRRSHPELHLSEDYVNRWGGGLLGNSPQRAVAFFKYNTEQWPNSWNAFDSLAEGYERLGDTSRAIANYRRSLELNAGNDHAVEQLKKLIPTSK